MLGAGADDPEGWYKEGGGRGFRMGNTCTPVADSCWCMAKAIQYCKVKNNNKQTKKPSSVSFSKSDLLLSRLLSNSLFSAQTSSPPSTTFQTKWPYTGYTVIYINSLKQTKFISVPELLHFLNIHWKDWCWSSNTLATWCKELTHWKRPWCWERLKAKG